MTAFKTGDEIVIPQYDGSKNCECCTRRISYITHFLKTSIAGEYLHRPDTFKVWVDDETWLALGVDAIFSSEAKARSSLGAPEGQEPPKYCFDCRGVISPLEKEVEVYKIALNNAVTDYVSEYSYGGKDKERLEVIEEVARYLREAKDAPKRTKG